MEEKQKIFGYARTSTREQKPRRLSEELREAKRDRLKKQILASKAINDSSTY